MGSRPRRTPPDTGRPQARPESGTPLGEVAPVPAGACLPPSLCGCPRPRPGHVHPGELPSSCPGSSSPIPPPARDGRTDPRGFYGPTWEEHTALLLTSVGPSLVMGPPPPTREAGTGNLRARQGKGHGFRETQGGPCSRSRPPPHSLPPVSLLLAFNRNKQKRCECMSRKRSGSRGPRSLWGLLFMGRTFISVPRGQA